MTAIFLLIRPFLPYIIGAIVLVGGAVWFGSHERGIGEAKIQAKWDADTQRRIKATTDMTLLWDKTRQEKEEAQRKLDDERQVRTAVAVDAAKHLPDSVARIAIPRSAVLVLNNAIGDSAEIAGPAAKPAKETSTAAEGADSNVGLLIQWGVGCLAAYDEARGMVTGWQDFYQSLRQSQ